MEVVEIFKSIDGEGIRVGFPVTFIRLKNCNLRCEYCDTKYSYGEGVEFTEMSPTDILLKISSLGCNRITLTGGEPLIHKDVDKLVDLLCENGYEVNIETNGSIPIDWQYLRDNTIITMDYKCYASGMTDKMCIDNFKKLREKDVLKFVVGSEKDLELCKKITSQYDIKAQVYVSPVFGQIEPREIVEYMLKHKENNWRVQVQLHKILWNPEERGV